MDRMCTDSEGLSVPAPASLTTQSTQTGRGTKPRDFGVDAPPLRDDNGKPIEIMIASIDQNAPRAAASDKVELAMSPKAAPRSKKKVEKAKPKVHAASHTGPHGRVCRMTSWFSKTCRPASG